MAVNSYILQYGNVDASQIINANVDLFITEGGPLTAFAGSAITAGELTAIRNSGTTVIGYVNVAVTDDNRPYWDTDWTFGGGDMDPVRPGAPGWLRNQPGNGFGYVVDFTDSDWQDIVITQAVDLVRSGFDGVFLDDFAQYFIDAATPLSVRQQATAMMDFAVRIDAEIRAVNPDAKLYTNGNPYAVTDAVGGATSASSTAFLNALDGMLLESYFGINAAQEAAITHARTFIEGHADLLALEYGGTDYQRYLFAENAAAQGITPFAAPDAAYNGIAPLDRGATNGDDTLAGTDLGEIIFGAGGNDTISGGAGNDLIDGWTGNDIINGGTGADYINGGDGADLVHYDGAANGVQVFLYLGYTADDGFGNAEGIDNIEWVLGTGHADTLVGDEHDNVLVGGDGADVIFGGYGNDYIAGGRGGDYLNASAGFDVFAFGAADFEPGVYDGIHGFNESGDNTDTLLFSGLSMADLVFADFLGDAYISTTGLGFTGGIRVFDTTVAELFDQIAF